MEENKVKKLEITVGAAHLISRLIVSCHELSLDTKSAIFVCKAFGTGQVCEIDFLQADKMGLYNNLIATAEALGKIAIDQEVVIKYFGGKKHEQATLKEVIREGEDLPLPLQMFLLVHILIPVKITGKKETGLVGEYCNDGKKVTIEGMLLFKDDLSRDLLDKTVLFHYVPVMLAESDQETVGYLLSEQKKCEHFMKALEKFDGKTIDVSKFSGSVKRTMQHMEL